MNKFFRSLIGLLMIGLISVFTTNPAHAEDKKMKAAEGGAKVVNIAGSQVILRIERYDKTRFRRLTERAAFEHPNQVPSAWMTTNADKYVKKVMSVQDDRCVYWKGPGDNGWYRFRGRDWIRMTNSSTLRVYEMNQCTEREITRWINDIR